MSTYKTLVWLKITLIWLHTNLSMPRYETLVWLVKTLIWLHTNLSIAKYTL